MDIEGEKLNSWEEFLERLKGLENECSKGKSSPNFLYRGQGRKDWKLWTTLERHGKMNLSLMNYFRLISMVKPQIESFAGENWNIPSYPDGFAKLLGDNQGTILFPNIFGISDYSNETYPYMVNLRHYDFPSPLLDWSSSAYVAAYFAFNNVLQRDEDVSIFVYIDSTRDFKIKWIDGDKPWIYPFSPYVKADRRHFIQQSRYTICITRDNKSDGELRYAPHEEVFARNDPNQDVLWEFNIPWSERLKVLKLLDSYNINALSLFDSKESLMETMALREIHFK